MAIIFSCPCGKPLKAKIELAGKRTKCPFCGAIVPIPAVTTALAGAAVIGVDSDPSTMVFDWSSLHETPAQEPPSSSYELPAAPSASKHDLPVAPPSGDESSQRYKILTQRDKGFTGKFDPVKLEHSLNEYASKGWSVKAAVTMNTHDHTGSHCELVIILEH